MFYAAMARHAARAAARAPPAAPAPRCPPCRAAAACRFDIVALIYVTPRRCAEVAAMPDATSAADAARLSFSRDAATLLAPLRHAFDIDADAFVIFSLRCCCRLLSCSPR